jgi:hypothetical protein
MRIKNSSEVSNSGLFFGGCFGPWMALQIYDREARGDPKARLL